MIRFTCVPKPVAHWLHVLRPMVRHRQHLVFCWRLVCQAVSQDKATLTGLARLTPRPIAERHVRRLLTAIYGHGRVLLWWVADHVVSTRPPPEDGVCSLVVESTLTEQTGQRHPLAQQGRLHA